MPQPFSSSDCAAFAHLLPLLDGDDSAMTPALAAARAHVRECTRCQHILMDYQHIDDAVRRYYAVAVPLPLQPEAIMDFIAENAPDPTAITTPPPKPIYRRWPKAMSAALITALVIILVAGFTIARWHSHPIASPPPTPSNLVLDSVSMISPNEGWAIANPWDATWDLNLPKTWKNSTMYHYLNGIWTPEILSAPTVVAVHIFHFHMISHSDGWAIGDAVVKTGGTRQMIMHYDGTTWSPIDDAGQATPDHVSNFIDYRGFQVLSDHSLWVASFVLSSGDTTNETKLPAVGHLIDGHIWKIEYLPLPFQGTNINLNSSSISMVNDDEGWITARLSGSAALGQPTDETVLYHRSHGSWVIDTTIHGDDMPFLSQVAMLSPSDGWAVGQHAVEIPERPVPLVYHYSQNKWTPYSPGVTGTTYDPPQLCMLTEQNGWMFLDGDQLQIYHYDGTRWSLQQQFAETTPEASKILGCDFASPNDGWGVGYRSLYKDKNTQYYYPLLLHYTQGKWSVYP